MDVSGNTVLVTGGGSGIGLALATRFHDAGSKVIVCGRRADVLEQAKREHGHETIQCDVAREEERERLFETVTNRFPDLNVLVNNAGIQNRPPAIGEPQDWSRYRQEIAINLEAPIHFTLLFAPFLAKQKSAAIINITSGLAFVPIAAMPTYCATKAAMHSFTMSTRKQLEKTAIKVIEVAPPGVNTDLGGKGLHDWGVPLDEFADHAFKKLQEGDEEFGYQFSVESMNAGREERQKIFERMNSR